MPRGDPSTSRASSDIASGRFSGSQKFHRAEVETEDRRQAFRRRRQRHDAAEADTAFRRPRLEYRPARSSRAARKSSASTYASGPSSARRARSASDAPRLTGCAKRSATLVSRVPAIFSMLSSVTLPSPFSTAERIVREMPARSASVAWERRFWARRKRTFDLSASRARE
jgi:hypothetical protein